MLAGQTDILDGVHTICLSNESVRVRDRLQELFGELRADGGSSTAEEANGAEVVVLYDRALLASQQWCSLQPLNDGTLQMRIA